MKPIEEALKRWWQWRYGYNAEVPTTEKMWEDFHLYRELERNGGGLTYKQFLYDKLQEVANEQYDKLEKIKALIGN